MTRNTGWMARAACQGLNPNTFHPTRTQPLVARQARQVCNGCPVIDDCAEYAINDPNLQGVWGGMSWIERTRIRQTRKRETRGAA